MTVAVRCPNSGCQQAYRVAEEKLGKQGRCKKCGTQFTFAQTGGPQTRHAAGKTQAESESTLPGSETVNQPIEQLGRFKIEGRLGAGAFGTVYLAHDPKLDREVALKVLHAARLNDPESGPKFVKRFLNEAKATARLQHPHIVPVFDAGQDGEDFYIASSYIKGATLDHALKSDTLKFQDTARIVMRLAEALAYAHEQGIIHRDVKPANVMLDPDGEPHLMDFGLARMETSDEKLTQDGNILGTLDYMSPEQALGDQDKVGPPSDQYSLGVLLYELLCGQTPFSGTPAVLIFNILNAEPPSPRKTNQAIPIDLETICLKTMAKEKQQRYENCQNLADDLQRWLDDKPIRARSVGRAERLRRWCKRNPLIAGLSLTISVLLLAASVAFISHLREAKLRSDTQTTLNQTTSDLETAQSQKDALKKAQLEADKLRNEERERLKKKTSEELEQRELEQEAQRKREEELRKEQERLKQELAKKAAKPMSAKPQPVPVKPPPVTATQTTPPAMTGIDVVLPTNDGWGIYCTYFISDARETAPASRVLPDTRQEEPRCQAPRVRPGNRSSPVVVLLHMRGNDRRVWQTNGFAAKLNGLGYAVISVDLRTFGESRKDNKSDTGNRGKTTAKTLTSTDYQSMVESDLEAVKKFIYKMNQNAELDMRKMAIIAAEMSAPIAMQFAADDWNKPPFADDNNPAKRTPRGQDVRALVLMSPESILPGVPTNRSILTLRSFDIPCLVCSGEADVLDKDKSKRLYAKLKGRGAAGHIYFTSYPYAWRGTDLLGKDIQTENDIIAFLKLRLMDLPGEWRDRKPKLAE